MTGPKFFQTGMGRKFYESTAPKVAEALERIAAVLERLAAKPETLDEMFQMFRTMAIVDKKIYSEMTPGEVAKEMMDSPVLDMDDPIHRLRPAETILLNGRTARWYITVLKSHKIKTYDEAARAVFRRLVETEMLPPEATFVVVKWKEDVGGWEMWIEQTIGDYRDAEEESS